MALSFSAEVCISSLTVRDFGVGVGVRIDLMYTKRRDLQIIYRSVLLLPPDAATTSVHP